MAPSDPTIPPSASALPAPSGDSPKRQGDPLAHPVDLDASPAQSQAAGNPAAYDLAAHRSGGTPASDPSATSKALHPAGSHVPEAAHKAPGMKLEEAVAAGLTDEDPADRPHGDPSRPAPEPNPPGGSRPS